jgi:hypothetical protein
MGLDSVELVMAVEEKFGITISDEEAQEMRTVGDMHRCVLGKVMMTEKSSCLTQKAFHLLRRTAKQLFSVPRDQFRPDAQLNLIVPKGSRRENWRKFQSAVGAANWPKLALSWAGALTLLALVFAVPWSMFVFGTAVLKWNALVSGTAALAVMVLSIRARNFVTRPFETEFRQVSTVRDLAYVLAAQNPQLFGTEHTTWTADETWAVLASVIKVQTGVSQFTQDSRFVDDLKID